jgi:predicted enzyme related to lactoylglutathione lyase
MATNFFWYELMTSDLAGAEKFYPAVIGWTTEEFPNPDMRYIVVNAAGVGVGGLMTIPEEAAKMGAQPAWMGYIHASDVDSQTASLQAAGGHVHRPPEDIPGVGRFSVVADPQGAMFMLLQPTGPDQGPTPMDKLGHVGWHELMTEDWQKAFDFYAAQYGWTKDQAVDMGEMGVYQLYAAGGGQAVGGMMNKAPHMPINYWGFYFNVDGIDAAAKRCTDNGGAITFGPMEVPGGQWVVNCTDPQGAHFSMVSNTK